MTTIVRHGLPGTRPTSSLCGSDTPKGEQRQAYEEITYLLPQAETAFTMASSESRKTILLLLRAQLRLQMFDRSHANIPGSREYQQILQCKRCHNRVAIYK